MLLRAHSLVALLLAVTANGNQPCDTQDCGHCDFTHMIPLPSIKYASPGGKWEKTWKEGKEVCNKHGYPQASSGLRIKACNNNQSLEYPDIDYHNPAVTVTCAPDHPCPDGITVYPTLCC